MCFLLWVFMLLCRLDSELEKKRKEKKRKEKKRKEKKRKEKKRKEKKRKEKKRKDYTFWRQFNEKPSIIPGCPG